MKMQPDDVEAARGHDGMCVDMTLRASDSVAAAPVRRGGWWRALR
jgi:hypothetical protein